MSFFDRLAREGRTINAMLRIYCHDHHGGKASLCHSCRELEEYAAYRLDRCPYGAEKPTCANCAIHCYGNGQREQVRQVMRYAGPRMLWRHPVLAILHLLDGRRSAFKSGERKQIEPKPEAP